MRWWPIFVPALIYLGLLYLDRHASAAEPPSMVFSSVLVGTVDDIPLYEIHFPGRAQPCYLAEGVMGGMAKGRAASLACPE